MAIHVLTENAIKYSPQTEEVELEIAVHHDPSQIEISVANTPPAGGTAALERTSSALANGAAETAYLEAMKRAASLPAGQSGLGLARVRQEAQLELELEPSLVRVTARGEI